MIETAIYTVFPVFHMYTFTLCGIRTHEKASESEIKSDVLGPEMWKDRKRVPCHQLEDHR